MKGRTLIVCVFAFCFALFAENTLAVPDAATDPSIEQPAPPDEAANPQLEGKPDRDALVETLNKAIEKAPTLGPAAKDFYLALYDKDFKKAWETLNKGSQNALTTAIDDETARVKADIAKLNEALADPKTPEDKKADLKADLDWAQEHLKDAEARSASKQFYTAYAIPLSYKLPGIDAGLMTFEREKIDGETAFAVARISEDETITLRFALENGAWKFDLLDTLRTKVPGVTREEFLAALEKIDPEKKAPTLAPVLKAFYLAGYEGDYEKAWGVLSEGTHKAYETDLKFFLDSLKEGIAETKKNFKAGTIPADQKTDQLRACYQAEFYLVQFGGETGAQTYFAEEFKAVIDLILFVDQMNSGLWSPTENEKIKGDKGAIAAKEANLSFTRENGDWKFNMAGEDAVDESGAADDSVKPEDAGKPPIEPTEPEESAPPEEPSAPAGDAPAHP